MSLNEAVAERLHEMSKLLELLGENQFKAIAHSRAARVLESLPNPVENMDKAALTALDGIGDKIADKILEYCASAAKGKPRIFEHEQMLKAVPPGLLDILDIPGLGPKTVRAMWQDLGITDTTSLKKAIDSGSLLKLPRMGEKAVEKIKSGLALGEEATRRIHLGLAYPMALRIAEELRSVEGVERVEVAGSLRRGRETIADIDLLVMVRDFEGVAPKLRSAKSPAPKATGENPAKPAPAKAKSEDAPHPVIEAFCSLPDVRQVISKGPTRASVRAVINLHSGRWKGGGPDEHPKEPTMQVDVRVIPERSFGAALMYFTGSKDHNVVLRQRALAQQQTLNEYGLFPEDENQTPPQDRGIRPVASKTEAEIYKALGLPYIPPELREFPADIANIEKLGKAPALIELADIKCDLHAHTTDSDGRMSMRELVENAIKRGFHTIAVTDHSKSSAIANGLSPERLRAQIKAVHNLNKALKAEGLDIRVLAGSEVDILSDGTMDFDDDLLAELDIVVASPHAALSQDPATATKRLLKAIAHPHVHIIGHPTGRLINRRAGLDPAMDELIAAAKEHNTALEINAHWMRLDLRDIHVRAATAAGALIAIDCDDHETSDFENLRFGISTARRGLLTPELCINAWPREKLLKWLKSKR
ncbi:MAG: PHP domain-containing protein [Planctomycetes bacterium]|nr:PHP domain-containing protein [Planctomycetota bacterium]